MSLRRKRKNRRFERRHVLDVKLRSSHRRQLRFRRLILVFILLVTVVGGGFAAWRGGDLLLQNFIYRNPAFTIHQLDIETDGVLAREQLVRWAGVKLDENLFALDLSRVKRDLELVPAIETVLVRRVLPNKLRVRVAERDPVVRVDFSRPVQEGGSQLYLLDPHGFVMFPLEASQVTRAQRPDYSALPSLIGVSANDLRPGRQLLDERVQAVLSLVDAFSRSSMVGLTRLRTINLQQTGFLMVTTDDHCAVNFGMDNFEAQLRRWKVIHDHGRRLGRQMGSLDLSVSNNVPVRWLDPAVQTAPPASSLNPQLNEKMFESAPIIVGLEIGTSKICAVVGEVGSGGSLNVVGVGQARSRGVRKGEIADPATVGEDVRNAIVEAEQMADVEIRSVFLGVTGGHIRGFTNRGVHPVVSADREITREDVEDVIKNAKAINLPAENYVLHAIRQHFLVDGQDGIVDPVGMLGARVEVDMHVVHGNFNRFQNPIRVVKGLQLEVDAIVFNGLASSLALLSTEQKELGCVVIDIGGGSTEYVVYTGGIIKHTGVLAVGGDHVSNDLAYGLKIPLGRAEELKLKYGHATTVETSKGETVPPPNDIGLPQKTINLEHLRRIMALRLEEILELIEEELHAAGLLDYVRSGILICGGGARIPGIQKLVEKVFQLPASVGKANCVSGLKSALDQPEFATAIGLARLGSFQLKQRQRNGSLKRALKETFGGFLRRG